MSDYIDTEEPRSLLPIDGLSESECVMPTLPEPIETIVSSSAVL